MKQHSFKLFLLVGWEEQIGLHGNVIQMVYVRSELATRKHASLDLEVMLVDLVTRIIAYGGKIIGVYLFQTRSNCFYGVLVMMPHLVCLCWLQDISFKTDSIQHAQKMRNDHFMYSGSIGM